MIIELLLFITQISIIASAFVTFEKVQILSSSCIVFFLKKKTTVSRDSG